MTDTSNIELSDRELQAVIASIGFSIGEDPERDDDGFLFTLLDRFTRASVRLEKDKE